jgi:hypothetical protein
MQSAMLNFLPATCDLNNIKEAVRSARNSSNTQPLIVVLFHVYDFREFDQKRGVISLPEISDLLKWLQSGGDIRLLSIGQATKEMNNFNAHRFLLNKSLSSKLHWLPSFLREGFRYQYADTSVRFWLYVFVFYSTIVTVVVLAFIIGCLGFLKLPFFHKKKQA